MATRRRTFLFLCALGFGAALAPATVSAATPVQDPGATFGGSGAPITTTTAVATTTTEAESQTNQTLVESKDSPDQPVFTENRKVAAVIAGLVIVALALLLLTIRYLRITKPSSADAVDQSIPMLPMDLDLDFNDDSVFIEEPIGLFKPVEWGPTSADPIDVEPAERATVAASGSAAAGADHEAADDDWQPRTGELERVEIPGGTSLARPGIAARRKALGVDPS